LRHISKQRLGSMGNLNNAIVSLIDKSHLTPVEVIIVLELITDRLKQLLSIMKETK